MDSYNRDYAYMCSPYSKYHAGRDVAFRDACRVAAALMDRGHNVFSPIAHSHPVEQYGMSAPGAHDFWLGQDFPLLANASSVLIPRMQGWKESTGVQKEIEWAKVLGKPLYYFSEDWVREVLG